MLRRHQLAVLLERAPGRPRIDDRTRVSLALLSRVYGDWRRAVVVVRPETVIRWHREIGRYLWKRRSRWGGRPVLPQEMRRLIGTIRRECLDHLIPFGERHLRLVLRAWVQHYNRGRPHSSLGPGIPDAPDDLPAPAPPATHRLPGGHRVVSTPVLGGLHHEYRLEKVAA